ncbi:YXWGXW repeat-containing protein [Edaphobacter sp. DSM 109919]
MIHLIKGSISTIAVAMLLLAAPRAAHAGVFVSVAVAPPAIPVYAQPPIPGDGYIWTPGYWAWTGEGYEWVDGAWVEPPYVNALWTPGYWGWGGGGYFWNAGYWGPSIGYYGGINYGFGYFGTGFYGGYWRGGRFCYNRGYNNFGGRHFGNVYDRRVAGFDGRPGGSSFVRHGDEHGFAGNREASIGGRNFGNRGIASNRGFAAEGQRNFASGNRQAYNNVSNHQSFNGARSYSGGNYAGRSFTQQAPRSYAQPSRGYSGGSRGYSQAPVARSNFSGGNGGFHGNAGGGGSFHGGGGGGGYHGGGGGGGYHGGGGGGSHGGGGGGRR